MKWSDNGSGSREFEQAPMGTYPARCVRIVDIGTHEHEYEGRKSFRRECIITWELPTCLMQEFDDAGKPFIVSSFYTASLHERSRLRRDLEAWRGKKFTPEELAGFDSKKILGTACLLSIGRSENGKAKVNGIVNVPQGYPVPDPINPIVYFSMDGDSDQAAFESLSKGVKKMIEASPEWVKFQRKMTTLGTVPAPSNVGYVPQPDDDVIPPPEESQFELDDDDIQF